MCLDFVFYELILIEDGLKYMLRYVDNLWVFYFDLCWLCVIEENLFVIVKNCRKLLVLIVSRCKGVSDVVLEIVVRYCK